METNNKLREALEELRDIVHNAFWSKDGAVKGDILNALRRANIALFAPSRNCDKFSKAEVLKILDDRSFSKEDTIEWLYADSTYLF